MDRLSLGEARYRAGAYDEAAAIFADLREENADDPTPARLLGLCRLRQGNQKEALELLASAYARAPNDPHTQLHYGLGLHAVGRHADAERLFRSSAQLLPADPAPYLNLSAALLALGDRQEALDAAQQARRRAPKLPQAIYMVGLTLLALDQLDAADVEFASTLQLAPDFADAWVNLGIVRYRLNDIERAKIAMRRALAVAPSHLAAASNLGVFLRLSGNVEAGERILRQVLEHNPAASEVRLNLAAALLQEERAADALSLLDEHPIPNEPHLARHWRLQRSLALLQLNRLEEARAAIQDLGVMPPELEPLVIWRRVLLALAEGDQLRSREFADQMEQSLATVSGLVPEHRIMAHFDLAKYWSYRREHKRAFPHWIAGHRLIGRFQPFSRVAHRDFVDATIARFDKKHFAERPRASNSDSAPVFIVGMPRSGTTLAEQIIGSHRQVFGAGERSALSDTFAALGGKETPDAVARIADLDRAALDAAAVRYLDDLHALAPDASRIVDKMPGNFAYLGLVARMLPGARVIQCVRDPRDIGLSIFTYRFFGLHPYAHDLADLGWYISQHDRLMAHWREALPNQMLTLALKDWVEDFDGTLRRVLEFLDLPYDPACERFYARDNSVRTVSRAQVQQPVNDRGLGRWRTYEVELQPLISELGTIAS